MASDDPKFACPACGKQYRWKPELAGRSAKCGCGGKLVVPNEPPALAATPPPPPPPLPIPAKPTPSAPVRPTPAPAAAVPAGANCPDCGTALPAAAVLCVNCGYNLKTGKRLSVVVEADADDADDGAADKPSGGTAGGPPAKAPAPPPNTGTART